MSRNKNIHNENTNETHVLDSHVMLIFDNLGFQPVGGSVNKVIAPFGGKSERGSECSKEHIPGEVAKGQ
jgi:hypothetical protein